MPAFQERALINFYEVPCSDDPCSEKWPDLENDHYVTQIASRNAQQ